MIQIPMQFLADDFRGAVPLSWFALQALRANGGQIARNVLVQTAGIGRIFGQSLVDLHLRIAAERQFAGQQFEQNDTQRIHIGSPVHRLALAARLFRRHVGGSAENLAIDSHCHFFGIAFCQAKIHQMRLALLVDHDIRRFEITVNHAVTVGELQGVGNGGGQHGCVAQRRLASGEPVGKRNAADQIADNIDGILLASDFMHRHDIRMASCSRRPRLSIELFDFLCIQLAAAWNFDRNNPIEFSVPCLPHGSEAADAEPRYQFEATDLFQCRRTAQFPSDRSIKLKLLPHVAQLTSSYGVSAKSSTGLLQCGQRMCKPRDCFDAGFASVGGEFVGVLIKSSVSPSAPTSLPPSGCGRFVSLIESPYHISAYRFVAFRSLGYFSD